MSILKNTVGRPGVVMSDQPSFRHDGLLAYQPRLLSREALLSRFVGRQRLFHQIVEELRGVGSSTGGQHNLIVGTPGSGKTAFLLRVQSEIESDPGLSKRWVALTFPERQYNIGRLSELWCNCLVALGEAYRSLGLQDQAAALDRLVRALPAEPEDRRSAQALRILKQSTARLGKRLVLLLDNIDLVFDRLRDDQWALREALSEDEGPVVIGTSARAIEATYQYDQAFSDFFAIHTLGGLSESEAFTLLKEYATGAGRSDVAEEVSSNPARVRVIHTLTQGDVRATVLFYAVLASGDSDGPLADLARILDYYTPDYRGRLSALPPQAQRVLDGVARNWDPLSAGEVADRIHLDVNAVSSQLSRLTRQGTIQKVAYHPSSKTGFQVADRAFNQWYLLRATPADRRRLASLVDFLTTMEQLAEANARGDDGALARLDDYASASEYARVINWEGDRRQLGECMDLNRLAPEIRRAAERCVTLIDGPSSPEC